jgi:hypothetical protein
MQDSQQSKWGFADDGPSNATISASAEEVILQWTASEFIGSEKRAQWFIGVALVGIGAAFLAYIISRELFSVIIVLLSAGAVMAVGARTPRELTYSLTDRGIHIGQKVYSYLQFKSFSIVHDAGVYGVLLSPLERFLPPITIYFVPDSGRQIVDTLARFLPQDTQQHDWLERFMRRIGF